MKAMRAIIWKELRENAKWAILAAIGFILLCVYKAQRTDFANDADLMKTMLSWTTVGAPLIGFGLGLLQIVPELRRDRWAFLLHRPASRTVIFFGKVYSGIGLYLAAIAVPFSVAVAWLATPGHVAAPFVPRIALPGIADILGGFIFYFAGMLTALRPARWYAGRGLGLAAALGAFAFVCDVRPFWLALAAILITIPVILAAAWGSFAASGDYGSQPRLGRFTLGLVLCTGIYFILYSGMMAVMMHLPVSYITFQSYDIDQSGRILRVSLGGGNATTTDLQGNPVVVKPASNGSTVSNYMGSTGALIGSFLRSSSLVETPSVNRAYHSGGYQFMPVNESDAETRWYFDTANRDRLQGYSLRDRRFIGSIGPDGFSKSSTGPGFVSSAQEIRANGGMFGQLYRSGNTVYTADLGRVNHFNARPFVSVQEPLLGVGIVNASDMTGGAPVDVSIILATRHEITCFNMNGKVRFTTPRAFDTNPYNFIQASKLTGKEHYFFRYSGRDVPEVIVETDGKGKEIVQHTLPGQPHRRAIYATAQMVNFGVVTPLALATSLYFESLAPQYDGGLGRSFWLNLSGGYASPWRAFAISASTGLLAAILAYLIGLRCGWDRKGRLAWAFGVFWLGIPGLLMLISLQAWPVRELCPACGKKRVVNRQTCEHCGSVWPAPQRNGTEIFELEAAA